MILRATSMWTKMSAHNVEISFSLIVCGCCQHSSDLDVWEDKREAKRLGARLPHCSSVHGLIQNHFFHYSIKFITSKIFIFSSWETTNYFSFPHWHCILIIQLLFQFVYPLGRDTISPLVSCRHASTAGDMLISHSRDVQLIAFCNMADHLQRLSL